MNGDSGLVASLVERLATRLPHRIGIGQQELREDETASITRTTLVTISATSATDVLEHLWTLLEDLSLPYESFTTHPPHVLSSEFYLLSLAADCCATNWNALQRGSPNGTSRRPSAVQGSAPYNMPERLDDSFIVRVFEYLKLMLDPISDGYFPPPQMLLECEHAQGLLGATGANSVANLLTNFSDPILSSNRGGDNDFTGDDTHEAEPFAQIIMQYITASNWQASFEYVRNVIYRVRKSAAPQVGTVPTLAMAEDERASLVVLRLFGWAWVDAAKLGSSIQEFCSNFLHFRRTFQSTIAAIGPVLIARWLERYPFDFVQLHVQRKRLDGAVDTLFDMTQTIADTGKRWPWIVPLQITLALLMSEVFEVASNLREAKSSSLAKRVSFLENSRKSAKNRSEAACMSLAAVLRAARFFERYDPDGEAAFVSYAMDVQNELKDAVFQRTKSGPDGAVFGPELTSLVVIVLAQFNDEAYASNLIRDCLQPNAPVVHRNALIQACTFLASHRVGDQYSSMFVEIAPFIQRQIKSWVIATMNSYIGDNDAQRQAAASTAASSATLMRGIMRFLNASPSTLFLNPPEEEDKRCDFHRDLSEALVSCVLSSDRSVRLIVRDLAEQIFGVEPTQPEIRALIKIGSPGFLSKLYRFTASITLNLVNKFSQSQKKEDLEAVAEYLDTASMMALSVKELRAISEELPEPAMAASRLETVCLVTLCSPDLELCRLGTDALRHVIFNLSQICESISEDFKSSVPMFKNLERNTEIFRDIASRDFLYTGVVAFQKRTRGLIRRLSPSPAILGSWEIAFHKWIHLSKDISSSPIEQADGRSFLEWRNLSGFLASLGGVCTSEQSIILEEPAAVGLKWIDRVFSENHEESLLTRYLRQSIQLLACTNVRVRETMREVLSTEVSPNLYPHLFRSLESELEVLFTGALETSSKGQDVEIIFAEQVSGVLKGLVDRLETPSELGAASSVPLGSLALSFAKFLDGVPDSPSSLRVRIKICQLCESLTRKKEHLNLRDDVRIRNLLLEYIYSWITRPRSPRGEGSTISARQDEISRVQRDLDKACLRSLESLTYRLPLQPAEGQSDAGASELKSQMFQQYFNRFLSLLNYDSEHRDVIGHMSRDESASTSEMSIAILSNLLSANIDVGLKHSLSIGYHENVEIRTAFIKVLYNILIQGTEFSNLSDAAVSEKYEELLNLLTNDMSLALSVSSVCPGSEVEELTISLLNVFETRGKLFNLIEALVKQEIEQTENEAELLRRNCVATKMLSIYAKWRGADYLKATLQKLLEKLMMTSQDLDLELDPGRVGSQEEAEKNALQLRIVVKVFIDDIRASATYIPASFRRICHSIATAVETRFPDAKYTAVGSFIFLRFFCPAIVAPEAEGLVTSPPSKEMRRGLLLIAKVIQNLANNVLFGAKEPYMFALNDFLSKHIFDVTAFLREISAPPKHLEAQSSEAEAYEFGSCIALHRFLYDNWDHVRQRLVAQERRDQLRSPTDSARPRTTVLEPLKKLITSLGPPPLAITWNRPQISINTPPAYSRFQHFMLRNAFRSSESLVTSRAVYDGGESKDGLSIICIILRHVDQDAIDYDTLIYCYLKIASRMWHQPFGLLIDATCYSGQTEPQDNLFKKLEQLSPAELSSSLSRIYIYNMNSAFRKCFRRVLRMATKNEASVFNPMSVDYHLLGSLQDLQAHFHLSQLHLPKETISVVTDTRYAFQPITRLSKTKGKIEVVIRVGSQFVQVATIKKQEVHPSFRLSAVVNDIFRLGDVEEAPTAIATEDDSTFGLRADSGKIVMYFQGAKKHDVLQAMRSAKLKYGKDTRMMKSFERLIRPQDVPGTLLNLALTNLAAPDPALRLSSYNLLGALCRAFKFQAASKFMCLREISIPLDPTSFIINISKTLAQEEPQLTHDFLNEFFVGWESFTEEQKPLSLAYMAPWIPGLRTTFLADESDGEKAREKIATIFRKLIDVTTLDPTLALVLEHTVWPAISQDETLLDIFLEEVIKAALTLGMYDEHTTSLTTIVTSIGTITLRGKIVSRLRKALNRSSLRPTKYLIDNTVWGEICVLLQFCLSLSFDSGVQAQLYLAEIFHIVSMLANTGTPDIRIMVHKLLINTVHSACTSFKLDDAKLAKLRSTLETIAESRNDMFCSTQAFSRDAASVSLGHDSSPTLANTENLAALLYDICAIAAPTVSMANAWRSRWMSLVASTAFQNNPAIQPRAFTVMGCLAREEVDDDLLYQVLVSLRNSVRSFGEDNNSDMLVAIVSSLSKMMAKLPTASRYGLQLFWLAISLLRLLPVHLFNCTALFLEAVLSNIGTATDLRNEQMAEYLMQGRAQLEDAAGPLDESYEVHFNLENFHYVVCACLVRGLTDTVTRTSSFRVLSTFLELTTTSDPKSPSHLTREFYSSPYLALIRSRAVTPEELKESLWSAGINPLGVANMSPSRRLREVEGTSDKDLLINTCIEMVDFQYLEDAAQNHTLLWLNELATFRPAVVVHLCSMIATHLDEILLNSQNSSTLEAAHLLLRTLSSNHKFIGAMAGQGVLMEILEENGLGGICKTCSFQQNQDLDKQCFALTERLIELIIA